MRRAISWPAAAMQRMGHSRETRWFPSFRAWPRNERTAGSHNIAQVFLFDCKRCQSFTGEMVMSNSPAALTGRWPSFFFSTGFRTSDRVLPYGLSLQLKMLHKIVFRCRVASDRVAGRNEPGYFGQNEPKILDQMRTEGPTATVMLPPWPVSMSYCRDRSC